MRLDNKHYAEMPPEQEKRARRMFTPAREPSAITSANKEKRRKKEDQNRDIWRGEISLAQLRKASGARFLELALLWSTVRREVGSD